MIKDKIIKNIVDKNTNLFFDNVMRKAVATEYGYQFFENTQESLIIIGQELLQQNIEFEAVIDDYFIGYLKGSNHKIIKDYVEKSTYIPSSLWLSKYQDIKDVNIYVEKILSLINIDEFLTDRSRNSSILAFFESLNNLGIDICVAKGVSNRVQSIFNIITIDRNTIMQYVDFGFDFEFDFIEKGRANGALDFQTEDYWRKIIEKNQNNKIKNNYLRLNNAVENKKFQDIKKVMKI